MQSSLGNQLRNARKKAGQTQDELARLSSLSLPTIRGHERGRENLSSFFQVLDALSLDIVGRNFPRASNIGRRIRKLREQRQLSQRSLAKLVGCSHPTIVALEKQTRGRLDVLERVLAVLGAGAYLSSKGQAQSFYTHQGNISLLQTYETPPELLERLYQVFGEFDLDPCSPTKKKRLAPVKAKVHFTEVDDGLSLPWIGSVFMNPPCGRTLSRWIEKAHHEVEIGNAKTVIGLIPARTDTHYWHEHVSRHADIFFLRGRLRFGDADHAAPFPSALIAWGANDPQIRQLSDAFPDAAHSPPLKQQRL